MTDLTLELDAVSNLPGGWLKPELLTSIDDKEGAQIADEVAPLVLDLLTSTSHARATELLGQLLHPDSFWRDLVALTWSIRTFHGADLISKKIVPLLARANIDASSVKFVREQVQTVTLPNHVSVVRLPFILKTGVPQADCTLAVKVVRMQDGSLKVFTITSSLSEVKAAPWQSLVPNKEAAPLSQELPPSTDVIIVGGGHGGLAVAANLKAMGVDFAILEKTPVIGDGWDKRYDSATLHTTRIFSGLPFFPFPQDYPLYVPASLIATHYREYVRQLQLPAYTSCEVQKATFDEQAKEWTVYVSQKGQIQQIRAKNIVFAIGVGGRWPIEPSFPGKTSFKGEQLHSVNYTNAKAWKGKKVAVIGASTTACDVCHDCSKLGIDVTMVQRGPTRIYPAAHIAAVQELFWNEKNGAELGDIITSEDPVVLQAALSAIILDYHRSQHDPEYYASLERAGFLAAVTGPIHEQIFCQGGKHYPDIGACEAISKGEIKVKSGSKIQEIVPDGLVFEDGSKLTADVILYATGFEKDVRRHVADVVGKEADKLEPIWGLNHEGEVRGCWRPSGHDRIWFQAGELQTMRMYGRFLAMQVAAEIAGVRPQPCRT